MKKYVIIAMLVVLTGIAYMTMQNNQQVTESPTPSASSQTETNASPASEKKRAISLSEVSKHNSKEDCYLAMEGRVYDVTPYVKSGFHPGKEAILMGCGKDATSIFNSRPADGSAHSDKARTMLAKYEIGVLSE